MTKWANSYKKPSIAAASKFAKNPFVIAGLATELLYISFYLLKWHFGELNLHTQIHLNLVITLLVILYLIYFLVLFKAKFTSANLKTIFLFSVLFQVGFIFVPFFTSNDLHSYIAIGRVVNQGANPYIDTYSQYWGDPLYPIISNYWSGKPTLYGPMFLFISSFINTIGLNHYPLTFILFKTLLIGANLVNGYLIYKITKSAKALFLYSWNPLVVYELAANAHNESLLIFLLLLSALALKHKRIFFSFIFLVLSILIKGTTTVFVPFYVFTLFKQKLSLNQFFYKSILIGAFCLGIAAVFYYPFWQGRETFSFLLNFYHGQTISPSLGIWLLDQVVSYTQAFKLNNFIFLLIGGLTGIWFLVNKYSFQKLIFACFAVYSVFILTKLSLVLSWYLTPIVALASLNVEKQKNISILVVFLVTIYHLLLYWFIK